MQKEQNILIYLQSINDFITYLRNNLLFLLFNSNKSSMLFTSIFLKTYENKSRERKGILQFLLAGKEELKKEDRRAMICAVQWKC